MGNTFMIMVTTYNKCKYELNIYLDSSFETIAINIVVYKTVFLGYFNI